MDDFVDKVHDFLCLGEQASQALRRENMVQEFNRESLITAYTNAVIITELQRLSSLLSDSNYSESNDKMVDKLHTYRLKLSSFVGIPANDYNDNH